MTDRSTGPAHPPSAAAREDVAADGTAGPAAHKPSVRKQEVIEVAKHLFAERGIRGATVRGIGASVGLLSGSLYHHFGAKDDLVDLILQEFTQVVLRRYDEIAAESADAATTLRAMARYAFSLVQTAPEEMAIVRDEYLFEPGPDGRPRFGYVVEFHTRVGQHWLDTLESGVASGEIKASVQPRILYRMIRDAVIGATRWWDPARGGSTDDVADALINVVLRGVVVGDAAARRA